MPTDDERNERVEGAEEHPARPARTGPRHAAPRKPLLTRLHMPAGKAIALAAMPSAVLMGMGLTPTLAQAKPSLPPNPFGEAGCVTAPDASPAPEETPQESPEATPAPTPTASGSATAKPAPGEEKAPAPSASRSREPSASPSAKPGTAPVPLPAPLPKQSPSASPSPSKAANPLDPLGLGDKLTDLLTGRKGEAKPQASPTPQPTPSTAAPKAKPAPEATPEAAPKAEPKATPGPGKTAEPTAKPSASASASGSPSATPSPSPSGSASASPSGEPRPCPRTNVIDENERRAFPNQPWYLEASKLTLGGLTYEGVKRITMVNGQQKSVLKFTADSLEIRDLHQIVNSQGKQYHVAGMGTTSTVGGAKITMYTEELKGNLLGLIPSTQSPSSPPPLIPGVKLPIPIFFTNVKIRQSGQYGGTLHIPNLRQYLTEGTYP